MSSKYLERDSLQVMSVNQAAELLALSPQSVYNMIDRGDLAASRIGKRTIRISVSAIQDLLGVAANA